MFPDTMRKNKNKKKGGQAAAAVSALVDPGMQFTYLFQDMHDDIACIVQVS